MNSPSSSQEHNFIISQFVSNSLAKEQCYSLVDVYFLYLFALSYSEASFNLKLFHIVSILRYSTSNTDNFQRKYRQIKATFTDNFLL